jgi:hypothetical protein
MSETHQGHVERHPRLHGVGDVMVESTGKLSKAQEYVHRVRGALDDLHRLIGTDL